MIRKIIVLVIIIVIVSSCNEESILIPEDSLFISGAVLDSENSNPISGALVTLNEKHDSTNIDGYFSFKNLKSKDYTLSITHQNYENYSQEIFINHDSILSINLSIIYNDYFPSSETQKKYKYSYHFSHPSPRPSSRKILGISTWIITNTFNRNDTTVYVISETRIDSVESYELYAGYSSWQYTISQEFEILESADHIISSEKFPQNIIFPRYIRSDEFEYQDYRSNNGFFWGSVRVKKNIGISSIGIVNDWGDDFETENYVLIE